MKSCPNYDEKRGRYRIHTSKDHKLKYLPGKADNKQVKRELWETGEYMPYLKRIATLTNYCPMGRGYSIADLKKLKIQVNIKCLL